MGEVAFVRLAQKRILISDDYAWRPARALLKAYEPHRPIFAMKVADL